MSQKHLQKDNLCHLESYTMNFYCAIIYGKAAPQKMKITTKITNTFFLVILIFNICWNFWYFDTALSLEILYDSTQNIKSLNLNAA